MLKFSIYRYNSEEPNKHASMQDYQIAKSKINGNMLLDALIAIQENIDPSLAFRKSCREGVCGSDGMNVNGKNTLACIVPISELEQNIIVIKPLSGMPIIRDLIVDFSDFFEQYEKIQPYLQNIEPTPVKERLQSIEDRAKLDGLYECVLCACCSTACPIYLKDTNQFIGPAAMLQSARFILDSRDSQSLERIQQLDENQNLFKCKNILTCVDACPKGLDPNKAINAIHKKLLDE